MSAHNELNDKWSFENGQIVRGGDAALIDDMLATKLVRVRTDQGGWTVIYRHRQTGRLWELSHPRSEMHGGGPRRLRLLQDRA